MLLWWFVTKMWTWDYVKRELPNIPHSVPAVLIMANSIDQSHHRAVTRDQVTGFIEETMEEKGGVQVASLYTSTLILLQQLCNLVEILCGFFYGAKFCKK